jgi:hypothetical protein
MWLTVQPSTLPNRAFHRRLVNVGTMHGKSLRFVRGKPVRIVVERR